MGVISQFQSTICINVYIYIYHSKIHTQTEEGGGYFIYNIFPSINQLIN